ncbi:cytochrome P450 2K1-like [Periophthalmus magnuspinnatus]|uniref:cytochrome P450 2K1-like n=1 Tax=Periophthalmus magnuspinnatus TaxID=409849 RepID=UPI00145A30DD|nr:cytochrome P450 2K1-like [Periophthalmus magnuspinnatus]
MGLSEVLISSPGSVLGLVLVLLPVYLIYNNLDSGQGPPGPKPVPILGNLLQIDLKKPYETLTQLSKQYGPVFTVWMGPQKVVVLAGYKTIKEALVKHAEVFGNRHVLPIMKDNTVKDNYGVIWSNGEKWRELRRFALTNLRDFGMGRKVCEDKIIEEAQCLCQVFNDFRGKVFDMTEPVNCAVSNIISSLVYGSRFEYSDPEFTTLVKYTTTNIHLLGSPSVLIYNLFPWLGRLVPNRNTILKQREWFAEQNQRFSKKLRDTLNPQMPRGFVDAFMLRQKNGSEAPDSPYQEENLAAAVLQLFAAGTETMSATLRSALLLMVKYPHIQDQVREEIFRVIGAREVQTEDKKDLPFTDAVLHETQRITNIVPLSLPRQTSQDITFQKYFIKRGTTVWPLLTSVLYEESEWEKPHSFYPAHFLHKDGTFRKRDAFMPFSAGRRICLGEGLARMELFIFFVTLMQRFRFTAPPGVNVDELELMSHVGFTLNSVPHKLCAIPCA